MSKQSNHTPGPWIEGERHETKIDICGEFRNVCTVRGNLIEVPNEEMEANARLIAAAPDLLMAVQGLLNAMPSATTHPAIKAARAAIAKAKGE